MQGFDWLQLDRDEELVWTGRPRTWSIIGTVGGALSTLLVAVVVVVAISGTPVGTEVPSRYLWLLVGGVGLLGAGQVGAAYLRIRNTDYVLTTHNLYRKTGVFSENVTRVGLDKVQNTILTKGLLGSRFDYGDVGVSTAGGSGVELRVTDVDDPGALRGELRRLVNATGGQSADGRRRDRPAPETVERVLTEARRMREAATGIEEAVRR